MDTKSPNTRLERSINSSLIGPVHRRILIVDLLCTSWATIGAQLARFGTEGENLDIGNHLRAPYWLVTAVTIVLWWIILDASGSRDDRLLGSGPEEYKRIISATLWLFGVIAIFSYVFQVETARGYVAIALPLGLFSILVGRWTLRAALVARRRHGYGLQTVLLIGGPDDTAHLHRQLSTHVEAGYQPVAVYLPGYPSVNSVKSSQGNLPVIGYHPDLNPLLTAIDNSDVSTVAITTGAAFDPFTLRQLGWHLAARNIGMIMVPALTDVAGPRIHTQPVGGLPLIHVTTPKLEGAKRLVKRSFDILASSVLLLLLLAPMLLTALLIRLDSPGPTVFRQERIGRAGTRFEMFKFRSMVIDADVQLESLRQQNEASGLLFKMSHDPRITRFGRFIRRYSIDELPQLINVLRGDMSLVGPRPPLPSEVAGYDDFVHRRLLVKPGITGLWQVSGRSDLSWEDSVRLDLYYVENWSLIQDLVILLRTMRAVLTKSGAY